MKKTALDASELVNAIPPKEDEVTAKINSMQSTQVFGQTIRYYDVGSGPVLVLLHGLASSAILDWGKVLTSLASTHRVLAMDEIGFGSSDKPNVEYRIQTYVDFLAEFLRQQQVEHFILGGVSFGGWIAAQYAIQATQRENGTSPAGRLPIPDKLLLCDAGGLHQDFPPELPSMLLPSSIATMKALLTKTIYDQSLVTDELARNLFISRLAAQDGWTVRSLVRNLSAHSEWVNDKLHGITIPTLIVWGTEDALFPLTHGRNFAANIPGAKLVEIEKCGHAPMVEKPNEFLAAIRGFLSL